VSWARNHVTRKLYMKNTLFLLSTNLVFPVEIKNQTHMTVRYKIADVLRFVMSARPQHRRSFDITICKQLSGGAPPPIQVSEM
jgi:hypothetical protein